MGTALIPQLSRSTSAHLVEALFDEEIASGMAPELVLTIKDADVSVRDLSACLEYLDRAYGRLTNGNLRSYAVNAAEHVKLRTIEKGSWELVIRESVERAHVLGILLLAIKYIPRAIVQLATAYESYEQGRLARTNRQRLEREAADEEQLKRLTPEQRRTVFALVDLLQNLDRDLVVRVGRFCGRSLEQARLRLRQKTDS